MEELSAPFDSVMIDFAKGLGSPAGAAIVGPAPWIDRARSFRKLLGGSIHQPGILPAACLYGLDHQMGNLESDHRKAARLAVALANQPGVLVDLDGIATNIVIARLAPELDPMAICASLSRKGVLVAPLEDGRLRFVTHSDVSEMETDLAIAALTEVFLAAESKQVDRQA